MLNESNEPTGAESPTPPGRDTGMAKKWKTLFGALATVALVAGLYLVNRYWIAPATVRLRVGDVGGIGKAQAESKHPVAPIFSLTDISGNRLSLADYKGRVVMLDFWATWCGPCRIEIPGFVELQNRYGDQGFAIIGISMDDGPEVVREFYKEFKMNYPVALGDEKLEELYGGIVGLPTTFIIGRDGRIYRKHTGATDGSLFEEEIKTLLAARASEEVSGFKAASGTDDVEVRTPEEVQAESNSEVPGVDISALNAVQLAQFKKELEGQPCTCGCKLNLLKCRRQDRACGVSRKLAREQLEKLLKTRA